MKQKTTVITREYNDKGDLVKEIETITENEYRDNYVPLSPAIPFPNTSPIIYPHTTWDKPNYNPSITCQCKCGD